MGNAGLAARECGPGGDLLFRRLSGSTIGAEGFHGRVRDGIGCLAPRHGHQAGKLVCNVTGSVCGAACLLGFCRCTRAVCGGMFIPPLRRFFGKAGDQGQSSD